MVQVLGAAIAKECAYHGANVAILGRREKALTSVANEIINAGGVAHISVVDISDEN